MAPEAGSYEGALEEAAARAGGGKEEKVDTGYHRLIALVITEKCPIRCRHCMYNCGPDRTEVAGLEEALDWVEQVGRLGKMRFFTVTGGEPFLFPDSLRRVVGRAAGLGLTTNVITSAYWATSPQAARKRLHAIEGLRYMSISLDDFHQEFVPLSHVRHALAAGHEMGLKLAVGTQYFRREQVAAVREELRDVLSGVFVARMQVRKKGRAASVIADGEFPLLDRFPSGHCRLGNSPMIGTDGSVYACCGPLRAIADPSPLVFGSLRRMPLAGILEAADRHPLFQALRVWGPGHLAKVAVEAGLSQRLSRAYVEDDPCHLCCDLVSDPEVLAAVNDYLARPEVLRQVDVRRALLLQEWQVGTWL